MKIKIILKLVAAALVMAFAFSVVSFAGACEDIESRVLRLHILANSDSESDQALKLKVRDAILKISPEIFGNTSSKQEAIKKAKTDLPKIIAEAERVIKAEGYNYSVRAEVVNDKFNTRVYENFTLPAGNYDAVRIIIGNGSGHNWWCVMFPALCLPSAEGNELQNEFPDAEKCIVDNNENSKGYEIRFGVVEAVSSFSDWLCSLF